MPRPATTLQTINNQSGGWDQTVTNNNDTLRSLLFTGPVATTHFHKTTANEGSFPLSSFPAADYKWCTGILVDAASPGTTGRLIYSDGVSWKYNKTNGTV